MKFRNGPAPPTRGAMLRSLAFCVGPVRSRRRSVFSMPTSRKGRLVILPAPTCSRPATWRKSSSMPPSGMTMRGSGVPGGMPAGRYTLIRRVSPRTAESSVQLSPIVSGAATEAGGAACTRQEKQMANARTSWRRMGMGGTF